MGESTREATRVYRNHGLDSTRWKHYRPRPTDVVVSTPYQSGTTWTLANLRELFALGEELPPFREVWLDCVFRQTPDEAFVELEAQEHRRHIQVPRGPGRRALPFRRPVHRGGTPRAGRASSRS